jgi:hypothetical protein
MVPDLAGFFRRARLRFTQTERPGTAWNMSGYPAGNKTCPKGDGIALCEDYIDAFDRVIQYHHVKRPAAGAFLSLVDCDEWGGRTLSFDSLACHCQRRRLGHWNDSHLHSCSC